MAHHATGLAAHAEREEVKAGPTVMVAEDYEETRYMLRLVLEMEGYRVVEACDGRDAYELARSVRPDLILMDLTMPVMDGITATRRIREEEGLGGVPIVAVTAHATPEYRHRALAAGCDEFITKPVDMNRLTHLAKSLLRERAGN